MDIRAEVVKIVKRAGIGIEPVRPPANIGADFSLPCFEQAKRLGQNPNQIAASLVKKIKVGGIIKDVRAVGGYVNIWLDWSKAGKLIFRSWRPPTTGQSILIEHTSANPDGPLHVGHLRNSVIGDSLARILAFTGNKVRTEFFVNDTGRQIGIAVMEWLRTKQKLTGKPDWAVVDLYIRGNRRIETNPQLEEKVRHIIRLYEAGDRQIRKSYRMIVESCLAGQKATLARIGIHHNSFVWESDLLPKVGSVLTRLSKKPCYRLDGKRVWIDLKQFGIERQFSLTREDGTTLYPARDLAYHMTKFRKAKININVMGADQKFYFEQLIRTLSFLSDVSNYRIVFYEHLQLPGGSMSTRAGRFVSVDEIVDQAVAAAKKVVEQKMPSYSMRLKERIAQAVGIGALKWTMLRASPEKPCVWSVDEALAFEGATAPYVQYSHARAMSVLRKAKSKPKVDASLLMDQKEILILKLLSEWPETVINASKDLRPHYIVAYLTRLADAFNQWYQSVPILKAEPAVRAARLALTAKAAEIMRTGLDLLGIEAPKRM